MLLSHSFSENFSSKSKIIEKINFLRKAFYCHFFTLCYCPNLGEHYKTRDITENYHAKVKNVYRENEGALLLVIQGHKILQ